MSDIKIVGYDENKSRRIGDTAKYVNYLELSHTPTTPWVASFGIDYDSRKHNMWRRARIEGKYITIECPPDEIGQYHLDRLKKSVEVANTQYVAYLEKTKLDNELQKQADDQERQRLLDVKNSLKFD